MENNGNSDGPKRTPLDIPEILSIVASNIREVEDMKNVRILNKTWKKETLKNWRNSAVFVLNKETMRVLTRAFDESAFMGLAKKAKEKVEAEIDPFLLRKLPFRNYRISKDVDIWEECADNELVFQEVLAPYANYLDVGECTLAPNNHVPQYEDDLDFNFKLNITELAITPLRNKVLLQGNLCEVAGRRWKPFKARKLSHLTISAPTARRQLALYAKELVPLFKLDNTIDLHDTAKFFIAMRMPNLETLHVKSGGGVSHILRALTGAAQDNFRFIKLKELTVASSSENVFYGDDLANYLDVVRPPLRVLKIPIWWGECIREARFIRSLRLIQSTLTQLELHLNADLQFDILVSGFSDLFLNGWNGMHFS